MKARRRHALKENVLAHELGQIRAFFSRYGNWVLAGVTAVAIVLLVVWYYVNLSRGRAAEELAEYQRLSRSVGIEEQARLNGLVNLAETAKDQVVAAASAVFAGDLCAQKHLDAVVAQDRAEAPQWRDKAEKYYHLAIEKYPERKMFRAKAHLGLGILAEDAGNVEAARAEYEQASRLVNESYPVAMEAQRRLANLQTWERPARFATTTQASQPATSPAATRAAPGPATAPSARPPATSPAAAGGR